MSFLYRSLFPRTKLAHELFGRYFFEAPSFSERVAAMTTAGKVLGFKVPEVHHQHDSDEKNGDLYVFRGIPYAVAERNAPPKPVEPWTGEEKDCLMFGPACYQPPYGVNRLWSEGLAPAIIESIFPQLPSNKSYSHGRYDEKDCLNVNVFTPSLENSAKKKVLVWIHGGAFQVGSNVEGGLYDGSQLAKAADACVISINYRLHTFGFLHFPADGITNIGIRDQIAALEWVRDNCQSFGGDPNNITVMGESAGGMSVATLLGSSKAKGLFHKAICMSGAGANTSSPQYYSHQFEVMERCFTKELGGKPMTPDNFASIPVEMIQARMAKLLVPPMTKELGTSNILFQPIQDGDIIPFGGPHEGLKNMGTADGIPVMTGHLRDEMRFFSKLLPGVGPPSNREKVTKYHLRPFLRNFFGITRKDDRPDSTEKWAKIADELYDVVETSRKSRDLPTDVPSVADAITSLLIFEDPSHALARDAPGGGGYRYTIELDDEPMRSAHMRDVALLFKGGHLDLIPAHDSGMYGDWSDTMNDIHKASNYFLQAVTSFAETGTPSIEGAGHWGRYRSAMDIRAGGCSIRDTERPELMFLQQVKEKVLEEFEEVNLTTLDLSKVP